jgi:hypothetical protein
MAPKTPKTPPDPSQLELPIDRPRQPDRNYSLGGRSFYFFDLDDNVLHLPTSLFLFDKASGSEMEVSTREYAKFNHMIGKEKPWDGFEIRLNPQTGSFRRFRHRKLKFFDMLLGRRQPLYEDLMKALKTGSFDWKGPSWDFFWHAVHNERPLSIITARGHTPDDIKEAITLLVKKGHLSREPNYLSIYPVSHAETQVALGDLECKWSTAHLKKAAIHYSVEAAFRLYGLNTSHRFGMSDDDPANIKLIIEAMQELKALYPKNSFFVIDTQNGQLFKQEVFTDSVKKPEPFTQLSLFEKI